MMEGRGSEGGLRFGTLLTFVAAAGVLMLVQMPPDRLHALSAEAGAAIARAEMSIAGVLERTAIGRSALTDIGYAWRDASTALERIDLHALAAGLATVNGAAWDGAATVSASHATPAPDGFSISAGNPGIASSLLETVRRALAVYALPQLAGAFGRPFDAAANIQVYTQPAAYAVALRQYGMTGAEAGLMASRTGGAQDGNNVFLALYNDPGTGAMVNVLTHELTHVSLYQQGILPDLPAWVNEGTAWYEGLSAEARYSPGAARGELAMGLNGVEAAWQADAALPLTAGERAILHASYDVEIEDYEAVDSLVQSDGWPRFAAFLREIPTVGFTAAFAGSYGQRPVRFERTFAAHLGMVTAQLAYSTGVGGGSR